MKIVVKTIYKPDTTCIGSQLRKTKKFTTHGMIEYGFTIVNLDEFKNAYAANGAFWDKFHKKYGGFYTVSKPIFTCDRTKAFIEVTFLCDGECGEGSEMILEKINDRWVLKKKLSSWVG